jgi:hypothetical protein
MEYLRPSHAVVSFRLAESLGFARVNLLAVVVRLGTMRAVVGY